MMIIKKEFYSSIDIKSDDGAIVKSVLNLESWIQRFVYD